VTGHQAGGLRRSSAEEEPEMSQVQRSVMRRFRLACIGLSAGCLLVAACSGSGQPVRHGVKPDASGTWAYPNGDLANTRDAAGSVISAANVRKLGQAWSFHLTGTAAAGVEGTGGLAMAPIVADGVVYIQDLDSNVYALTLTTGKLKWEYRLDKPMKSGPGPDGVAVADGRVYGISPTTAFALNAATGKPAWVDKSLLTKGQGTFEIQPQVANGRVYLASAYGIGPGGGVLMALSASTGKLLWRFNTLLGEDPGVKAVGAGSGGAWETPLVGSDGSVTFGIGNPYQSAASAIAEPSAQLYTDSDVSLDAATGKLRWYYQGVPDDFKDYDMQLSPIAATANGVPVVIGGGKMGYVYEMNAATGKLIWKTPVGKHNGHDNDSVQAMEHKSTLKAPYTILPGSIGGVETDMALAGGTVYVAVVNLAFTAKSMTDVLGSPTGPATGQIEALSVATGKVEWSTKVSQMPFGAATVSNNLVFTTLYDGVLIALNRFTGKVVYRLSLPTSANAPIAIAGNTVLVPAGGPDTQAGPSGNPQLVAYTVP
jgi:outer membrane protein assembly factor BamB